MIEKDHSIARKRGCRDSWHSSWSCAGEVLRAINSELVLLLAEKEHLRYFYSWKSKHVDVPAKVKKRQIKRIETPGVR